MPDISAACHRAVFFVIVGDLDPVQDPLRRRDLIRPHDHQHILGGEDAVFGQDIQDRVPGKEGSGEVDKIWDHPVAGIGPEAGELETVAGFFFLLFAGLCVLDGIEAGAVGIILGVRPVADDKNLDILEQAASRPEGIPLIPVDLVESLPYGYAPPLQLHMDHREAVDEDRHIVAVVVLGTG